MKKIALIDGYGFVFRAYHSLPPLSRSDGVPVGAVYGFTNMLIKLLAGLEVSHMAVVFDSGSKTFRNDIFPEYKANRPPCPEDLKPQFPIVREAAEALNLTILEKTGFEADDIIATIAKDYAKKGFEVLIISSDKDLMQLIDDNISMYDAMRNRLIGEKEVLEKFLVKPNQLLDLLSLIGDSSDNVPGVKGIGPKTAAELLGQFGSLENIFHNLDQIKQDKRRQMLEDGRQNAKLSKELITLREDVQLAISHHDMEIKAINLEKFTNFLQQQGFRSLLSRIKKEFNFEGNQQEQENQEHQGHHKKVDDKKDETEISFTKIVKTELENKEIVKKLKDAALHCGNLTIDYQCENEELKFITFLPFDASGNCQEIFYSQISKHLPVKVASDLFSFEENNLTSTKNTDFVFTFIEEILSENSVKKIFFDAKEFLRIIELQYDFSSKALAIEDVSLINHLINSSIKNDLRELIDINLYDDVESLGFGEIFAELKKEKEPEVFLQNEAKKIEFFTFKNYAICKLFKILRPKINELKLSASYLSFELPLLQVLAQIESAGIKIDIQKLNDLSQEFAQKIQNLTSQIHHLAGQEFNIASTKQLSEILFEKLGLESSKKSKKTGNLSTSSEVLEELAEEGHKIADLVLDFRKFSKLKNTYSDALPKEINPKTNRIHTHLSTISTVTGRLSSNAPNLQNIPVKSQEGQKIRSCFIAGKNSVLISADYSQIELRVIAHVAKIENLIKAFKEDKDIHRITASQVFGVKEEEISDELRNRAKAINFGIIYGISGFGLAKQLGISRGEASVYIKSYLATYPGIEEYMKNYIEAAQKSGFVETISGRKCMIRGINDKNPIIRQESERLAINAPIQGSAADIIKKAMIRLNKKFYDEKLQSKIILQIHDELLIEATKDEVEAVEKIVRNEMEKAMILDVPLKVDVKTSNYWC